MSTALARRRVGFLGQLLLLWQLRLALLAGGTRRRGLAAVSFLMSVSPAVPLFVGAYALLTWGPVERSPLWPRLALDLITFVTACVWVAWPILSAGVDDHSEVARYVTWPVSPWVLLVASTVASLLEPLAIIIAAPMLGAVLGFARTHPPSSWPLLFLLVLAYALAAAAWSRAGLHLVLGVLRRKKSAQTIGGFLAFVLLVSLVIPPVDLSWLFQAAGGLGATTPDFAVQAALGLSRVPTGYLGEGLRELALGRPLGAFLELFGLLWFGAVGFYVAWRLLLRFHRAPSGRATATTSRPERRIFARAPTRFRALLLREAVDLVRNPRARLLFFVPFLLAVALKLLSARRLLVWLVGPATDAWFLGSLCLYAVVIFGVSFAQNAFGYDGRGLATLLAAPIDPGEILRAKNLVHGAAGIVLALLLCGFYLAYFRHGGPADVAVSLAGVAAMVPVLLAVGNLASVRWPTRFHASLERRDRQPRVAILTGIAASSIGGAPFVLLVRHAGGAPGFGTAAVIAAVAVVYWAGYLLAWPAAARAVVARREAVLLGVTRE